MPDTEPPVVSLTYPIDNAVIGDSIRVKAEAHDNEEISEVRFFFDGLYASKLKSAPYEFLLHPSPNAFGSHTVFARAYDFWENESASDTIVLHFRWRYLFEDNDDHWVGDLRRFYLRSDSSSLHLRIETDLLREPGDTDPADMDLHVYLDVDQDESTGKSVNLSGADYFARAFVISGDICQDLCQLYYWDPARRKWSICCRLKFLKVTDDNTSFYVGIRLMDLDDPDAIDIVVTNFVVTVSGRSYSDVLPNEPEGPMSCAVDRLYIGGGE